MAAAVLFYIEQKGGRKYNLIEYFGKQMLIINQAMTALLRYVTELPRIGRVA